MGKLETFAHILHFGEWQAYSVTQAKAQAFGAELKAAGYAVVPVGDEVIERAAEAMWALDADQRPWATAGQLEGVQERYRARAKAALAAMLEQDT